MLDLELPLTSVPGIGPRRAASLGALGCRTVEDLLFHLPFRYEDRRRFGPLAEIREGDRVSFLASVRAPRLIRTRRRGFSIFHATLDDGSAAVPAVWYNQPYLWRTLGEGRSAYFYGELRRARTGRLELRFENPQFEIVDEGDPDPIHAGRIVPVYEKLGTLTGKIIRRLIHSVLESEGPKPRPAGRRSRKVPEETVRPKGVRADFLPTDLLERLALPPRAESLREVHFPSTPIAACAGVVPWSFRDPGDGASPIRSAATSSAPSADTGSGPSTRPGSAPSTDPGPEPSTLPAPIPVAGPRSEPSTRPASTSAASPGTQSGTDSGSAADAAAHLDALNRFASPHQRRLIFEELYLLQLGLAIRRALDRREERGFVYATGGPIRERLKSLLPFRLTEGQRKVLREIVADLTSPHPMNRLLQGDVGSGKTIVAILAMALAAENGLQSALMAPTELLAEQHARSLRERLEPAGYRVVLLTSSVMGKDRLERLEALRSGAAQIAVGTHALQESEVAFRRLGLVIVDEQHRFGVMERARLREKGTLPDTLVMTATPIPRTLALALYGDLDVSLLEGLPPGRKPVATRVLDESGRADLYRWMREEIAKGRQAFVIYPLVEEREGSELRPAAAMAKRLATEVFPGRGVGLVHGRMKQADKAAVMEAFRSGRLAVLVATTVVEVGIDVPGATMLVVEHAERFGLSQLHQLRGRIGRGAEPGTCVLMAGDNPTDDARVRLAAIESETSGFRIGEIDLELRGPGEMFGTRQAGLPNLRVASLARDRELLEEARREAFALVGSAARVAGGPDKPGGQDESGDPGGARGPAAPSPDSDAARLSALLVRIPAAWRERFHLASVG